MNWQQAIKDFQNYLKLEKGVSQNTINSYCRDIGKLSHFAENEDLLPLKIDAQNLKSFINQLATSGISSRSQARIISGIKAFYKYLLLEEYLQNNPAELLETPKLGRKLPDFLSVEEVDRIMNAVDLGRPEGHRNRAILETLYGCGLRVSELVSLRFSDLFFKEELIRVIGKGDKERLVPINREAIKHINIYVEEVRIHQKIQKGQEDFVFLNRRGHQLTRAMIFTIVKDLSSKAGIAKNISPHTFRHSFATHLVNGGADLRAVQDMLGHESITTTEVYTHLDQQYLKDTIIEFHPRS